MLENIRLNVATDDHRPAVVCEDIEGLAISGLMARTLPGIDPVRLIKTTQFEEQTRP